jgi:hypothetical protein
VGERPATAGCRSVADRSVTVEEVPIVSNGVRLLAWAPAGVPGGVRPHVGLANGMQHRLVIDLTAISTGAFTGPKYQAFAALRPREAP